MTDEAHEHVLARWPADWLSDHCEDEHGLDPMGGDIADFAELERWHVAAHGYRIIGPEDEEPGWVVSAFFPRARYRVVEREEGWDILTFDEQTAAALLRGDETVT